MPKGAYYPRGESETKRLKGLLAQYDSRVLEKEAEKWGIEIPNKPEWHDTESIRAPDDNMKVIQRAWLNDKGRTMVSKQIRDARRGNIKWWADVLIPLMALAVAFMALFKDVIIAYIQANAPKP